MTLFFKLGAEFRLPVSFWCCRFVRVAGGIGAALGLVATAATRPPDNARLHWAFQAPVIVPPPKVTEVNWPRTGIDSFILSRLEAVGLHPASAADPRTLIRRLSFDLVGLPPSDASVRNFLEDVQQDRATAISRLIESLLASSAYGERWGRHWLDIARYSDTKGYVYGREQRQFVHASTYRDWVIRAFNEDLPYDRFILLQLAADQLVGPRSSDLAAMGFLTGGRRFLGVSHDIIDDRIDVVTRGVLGLTVTCARCHDHKYDPIPTQDYYSLYGVFHGADERLVPLAESDDAALVAARQKFNKILTQRREEAQGRLRSRAGDYLGAQLELEAYPEDEFGQLLSDDDIIPYSVRRWRDYLHQQGEIMHPVLGPWQTLSRLRSLPSAEFPQAAADALRALKARSNLNRFVAAAFEKPPAQLREAAAVYGRLFQSVEERWKRVVADAEKRKVAVPQGLEDPEEEAVRVFLRNPAGPCTLPDAGLVNTEFAFPTRVNEELWKADGEIDTRLMALGLPVALILTDRLVEPDPRVFVRGRASTPGESVPRQVPSVISLGHRQPFQKGSGRLELAQALTHPDNPLTARVMVNRVWQHHFGAGLVKTPSDLGLRAEPASHRELLDWLAAEFVRSGWSVKALHRLILSSAVYQQSGVLDPQPSDAVRSVQNLDPENRWLSFFPQQRLEFEPLRDAMLSVSGQLDLGHAGKALELLDAGNLRRTIYAFVDRQFLPGTFRTFDFANPDLHVAVRHQTSVPQQALFFLNGPFAAQSARALASRCSVGEPSEKIEHLYRILFQRSPDSVELAAGLRYLRESSAGADPVVKSSRSADWSYGTGLYDEAQGRVKNFQKLAHFTGAAWQGTPTLPGGTSGWAQITAEGGHPGNTRDAACVRRWTAPSDAVVVVAGLIRHEPMEGDGVRAFVVSSRHGLLASALVHHSKKELNSARVQVKAGDTLDFVVDIGATLNSDQFLWTPLIKTDLNDWDAQSDFGMPFLENQKLKPWEQYVQVLLLSNEFAFVD